MSLKLIGNSRHELRSDTEIRARFWYCKIRRQIRILFQIGQ